MRARGDEELMSANDADSPISSTSHSGNFRSMHMITATSAFPEQTKR